MHQNRKEEPAYELTPQQVTEQELEGLFAAFQLLVETLKAKQLLTQADVDAMHGRVADNLDRNQECAEASFRQCSAKQQEAFWRAFRKYP